MRLPEKARKPFKKPLPADPAKLRIETEKLRLTLAACDAVVNVDMDGPQRVWFANRSAHWTRRFRKESPFDYASEHPPAKD